MEVGEPAQPSRSFQPHFIDLQETKRHLCGAGDEDLAVHTCWVVLSACPPLHRWSDSTHSDRLSEARNASHMSQRIQTPQSRLLSLTNSSNLDTNGHEFPQAPMAAGYDASAGLLVAMHLRHEPGPFSRKFFFLAVRHVKCLDSQCWSESHASALL